MVSGQLGYFQAFRRIDKSLTQNDVEASASILQLTQPVSW